MAQRRGLEKKSGGEGQRSEECPARQNHCKANLVDGIRVTQQHQQQKQHCAYVQFCSCVCSLNIHACTQLGVVTSVGQPQALLGSGGRVVGCRHHFRHRCVTYVNRCAVVVLVCSLMLLLTRMLEQHAWPMFSHAVEGVMVSVVVALRSWRTSLAAAPTEDEATPILFELHPCFVDADGCSAERVARLVRIPALATEPKPCDPEPSAVRDEALGLGCWASGSCCCACLCAQDPSDNFEDDMEGLGEGLGSGMEGNGHGGVLLLPWIWS